MDSSIYGSLIAILRTKSLIIVVIKHLNNAIDDYSIYWLYLIDDNVYLNKITLSFINRSDLIPSRVSGELVDIGVKMTVARLGTSLVMELMRLLEGVRGRLGAEGGGSQTTSQPQGGNISHLLSQNSQILHGLCLFFLSTFLPSFLLSLTPFLPRFPSLTLCSPWLASLLTNILTYYLCCPITLSCYSSLITYIAHNFCSLSFPGLIIYRPRNSHWQLWVSIPLLLSPSLFSPNIIPSCPVLSLRLGFVSI